MPQILARDIDNNAKIATFLTLGLDVIYENSFGTLYGAMQVLLPYIQKYLVLVVGLMPLRNWSKIALTLDFANVIK